MWRIGKKKRTYIVHFYSQDKTFTSTLWSHLVWERNCRTSWVWWRAGRRSSRLAPAAWSHSGFELPRKEQNKQKNKWDEHPPLRAAVIVSIQHRRCSSHLWSPDRRLCTPADPTGCSQNPGGPSSPGSTRRAPFLSAVHLTHKHQDNS